jgi:hypothetical protein
VEAGIDAIGGTLVGGGHALGIEIVWRRTEAVDVDPRDGVGKVGELMGEETIGGTELNVFFECGLGELGNLVEALRREMGGVGVEEVETTGSRVVLVSDGFTEAENPLGEFFGEDRLDSAVLYLELERMLQSMGEFCAGQPAGDDCTVVQVRYSGRAGDLPDSWSEQGQSN